ncbi:MAG: sulfite exporter TauE/SafE family protein [Hyphomicrobiales bacterium]|nr:sulfite exporter TauE/SafE family protein [Hyphomicrobiales bacterium]
MSADISFLILGLAAILFGGMLKGVTGAGGPLVAIPLLASLYSIPVALAVMIVPGIVSNIWQMRVSRQAREGRSALWRMLVGCAIGVVFGTMLLGILPDTWLLLLLAIIILAYLVLRLARPALELPGAIAKRWALPVGLVTGFIQGAAGMSAPVGVTFITAQRLPRDSQVFVLSAVFLVLTGFQSVSLTAVGLMSWQLLATSIAALVPMLAGIVIGQKLARLYGQHFFDRLTEAVLLGTAVSLIARAIPQIAS